VLAAAVVQAAETVGVLIASVLAGIDTLAGRYYQLAGGLAITIIGLCTAVFMAFVARGLYRGRRWSRTPAVLTQLFVAVIAIALLQSHRYYDWGIPLILLAVAGLAMILAPPSLRLLTPGRPEESSPKAGSNSAK
jgi:hypothetical protein